MRAVDLSGSCVKDVQFAPGMPDMKIRTWCPFDLKKSNLLLEATAAKIYDNVVSYAHLTLVLTYPQRNFNLIG